MDNKTELLQVLEKQPGKDPYRFLAAHVFNKAEEEVSVDERYRFKEAFFVLFHFKAPDIIKASLEDLRVLADVSANKKLLQLHHKAQE